MNTETTPVPQDGWEFLMGKTSGRLEALERQIRSEMVFLDKRLERMETTLHEIKSEVAMIKGERKVVHWLWVLLATVAGGLSGHLFPHWGAP